MLHNLLRLCNLTFYYIYTLKYKLQSVDFKVIAISLEKHSSLTGHVYVIIMASVPRRSLSGSEGGAQRRVSSVIFLAAVVTHAHWFNERYNGCIVEQNHAGPPCSCYRPRHEFYTFSGKSRTWGHVIWLWWSLLKWLAYRQRLESHPCPCTTCAGR